LYYGNFFVCLLEYENCSHDDIEDIIRIQYWKTYCR